MQKLPKKINPDRIRDAVIEIKYSSNLPFEILLGVFFSALDDSYGYTNRVLASPQVELKSQANFIKEISRSVGLISLFYNSTIKFEIRKDSILFNCYGGYSSWEIYFKEIQKALEQLNKANAFVNFTRVGVRYISEYEDLDLQKFTKFDFKFGMPAIVSEEFSFRTEFKIKDENVILTLSNEILEKDISTEYINKISIIDIDVIKDNLQLSTLQELFEEIDYSHSIEKQLYFDLITNDFLESLKPEY